MKFKITKSQFEILEPYFKKTDSPQEIELEPIIDTASQALYEQELRNRSYSQGYHRGFEEGFFKGSKTKDYRCNCGCEGRTCYNKHCDYKCL